MLRVAKISVLKKIYLFLQTQRLANLTQKFRKIKLGLFDYLMRTQNTQQHRCFAVRFSVWLSDFRLSPVIYEPNS